MNNELYIVYVHDYDEAKHEFATVNIDSAVAKALSIIDGEFGVYIDVYELEGGLIYSTQFTEDDNITADKLKKCLVDKSDFAWRL